MRAPGPAGVERASRSRERRHWNARARLVALTVVTIGLCLLTGPRSLAGQREEQARPVGPSDREYWRLVEELSEPDGFFDSDNLISNENTFQSVIPSLVTRVGLGGAYIGVGPDQNFAYLAALEPAFAFIIDIRRGNLHVHLMYKALLELSPDRAEFLSRLFSRPRPAGLGERATADQLFDAYAPLDPDRGLYERNFQAIIDHLTARHGFVLTTADRDGIAYVYSSFFAAGPDITFESSRAGSVYPTYRGLQVETDGLGVNRGYLGSEEQYQRLRALQQENRIVPVVGNFAGQRALRAIGTYLKSRGQVVTAFYTSNVEQYLFRDRAWGDFAANVRTLPLNETSTFIRACFNICGSRETTSRSVTLLGSVLGLLREAAEGRIQVYPDLLVQSGAQPYWGLAPAR